MKLGIYGGTFNPVHNGHLQIAEAAQNQFGLDRILFIPACIPPHKGPDEGGLAAGGDRMAMIRLACKGRAGWECDELELRRGGASYTVDTLKDLRARHPTASLFLIVGSDNLLTFDRWRDPDKAASMAVILVYERPAFGLPPDLAAFGRRLKLKLDARRIQGAPVDISSSEIRRRIREKKTVSELVPSGVLSYIQAHGLYQ